MSEVRRTLTSTVRGGVSRVEAAARRARRAVDSRRIVTVRSGPAKGARISMRHASNAYRTGSIELPVQTALTELMRPGAVFFDVGANVGFFTLVAARAAGGDATLVAFEARSDIADTMTANLRRNGVDAEVWPVAVGEEEGVVSLLVAEHPGGATIAPEKAFDTRRVESVRQVSIDALVDSGRLPVPDVVKIDVEGAELAVLRGMTATLDRRKTNLICEVDAPTREEADEHEAQIESLLAESGYRCTRLAPSYEGSGWCVVHLLAEPEADPRPEPRST